MAGLKQVAEKAGVSVRTVTRVLNDEPHIKPDKREAVLAAVEALNYVPNLLARGLKSRRTGLIGIISNNIDFSIMSRKLAALQHRVNDVGLRSMIALTYGDPDKEHQSVGELAQICDGILFLKHPSEKSQAILKQNNTPFVMVDGANQDAQTIRIARSAGVSEAITTLKDHYEQFMLLTTVGNPDDNRTVGFHQGLAAIGQSDNPKHQVRVLDTLQFEGGLDEAPALCELAKSGGPLLCLCYVDRIAAGLLKGLHNLDVNVPEEIGIVGFDNDEYTTYTHKSISTVSQSEAQLAEVAMTQLQSLTSGENVEPLEPVPTRFVARETTLS